MYIFWRRSLRGLKKIGVRFHATGANYWLGAFVLFLCVIAKVPAPVFKAVIFLSVVWAALCLSSLIPDQWLDPTQSEKGWKVERKKLLEQTHKKEMELADKDESLSKALLEIKCQKEKSEKQVADLGSKLMRQYCYRITERLRSLQVDGSFDFVSPYPLDTILAGNEVRIKISHCKDYCAGELSFGPDGDLRIKLIKKAVNDNAQKDKISETIKNIVSDKDEKVIQEWIDKNWAKVTELAYDAYSRGCKNVIISKDDIDIFPDKKLIPHLCDLLSQKYDFRYAKPVDAGLQLGLGGDEKAA